MRTSRLLAAVVLALVGLVWVGQGTGIVGGSAMTGNSFWAVVGVVLLVAAAAIALLEARRSSAA